MIIVAVVVVLIISVIGVNHRVFLFPFYCIFLYAFFVDFLLLVLIFCNLFSFCCNLMLLMLLLRCAWQFDGVFCYFFSVTFTGAAVSVYFCEFSS